MKPFICHILAVDSDYTDLAVGDSREEVETRLWQEFTDSGYTLLYVFALEIKEIDGYEIILKKKDFE